jgi:transcription termination factor Rho
MSSVLDRDELERSPLADLHVLANELGVDGYRRLRKNDLIDAIVAAQSGSAEGAEAAPPEEAEEAAPSEEAEEAAPSEEADEAAPSEEADEAAPEAEEAAEAEAEDDDETPSRSRRGRRGGRGRSRGRDSEAATEERPAEPAREETEDRVIEGTVELLANGSGFVRLSPPEPTDDDAYVSAAQVKRCELVSGDRVGGPVRAPRRSERYPSMVRIDTINGRPADEVAEGTRFEDLPVTFPTERLALGDEDPTVKAVEWLTPFGKGSRVTITGAARSGKTETLRRVAAALAAQDDLEVSVVLAGARPEEVAEWNDGQVAPEATTTLSSSTDAQTQAIEQAVEQGRRVAARGGDAVVLVDSLEYLPSPVARRALAAARNIVDGGSLTVIAVASQPLGGETTVIALDAGLTALRRFPSLDLVTSGTMKPERLVGDAGAEAIAKARLEAGELA